MEFISHGSLEDVLASDTPLEWPLRFKFALDASKGLAFLHSLNVMHRDLKSANCKSSRWCLSHMCVVVDECVDIIVYVFCTRVYLCVCVRVCACVYVFERVHAFVGTSFLHTPDFYFSLVLVASLDLTQDTIKVTDFSLSRDDTPAVRARAMSMASSELGTPHWKAPELIQGRSYTLSSDVYSFGLVLWEIWGRTIPFNDFRFGNQVEAAVLAGQRPVFADLEREPETLTAYARLAERCWHAEPDRRPAIEEVVSSLAQLSQMSRHSSADATDADVTIGSPTTDLPSPPSSRSVLVRPDKPDPPGSGSMAHPAWTQAKRGVSIRIPSPAVSPPSSLVTNGPVGKKPSLA